MPTQGKAPPRRPTLLVVNQVAGPLMRQLLEGLAAGGIRCRLLTGWLDGPDPAAAPFEIDWGVPLVKHPARRRIASWGRFTLQAWRAILRHRGPVLLVTNPPLTQLAAPLLRWLTGNRIGLLVYDIYPDVMERMGMLRPGGLVARAWRSLSRAGMRSADVVITIGGCMAATLAGHMRRGEALNAVVLPNWADTEAIRPRPRADNAFAREHGLADKFVILYSGNFGATHDTESIVAAAERLTDLPDVHVLLIGGGTRAGEVARMVAEKALPNLTLLPLQPLDRLGETLTVADCSIVCLDEGYEGVSVPSKTYSALASGAALLAVTAAGTELADLVARTGCGTVIPPRSPQTLADAIRRYHRDRDCLARAKSAARAAAEQNHSIPAAVANYRRVLSRALGL